jgi:hypothetical protein
MNPFDNITVSTKWVRPRCGGGQFGLYYQEDFKDSNYIQNRYDFFKKYQDEDSHGIFSLHWVSSDDFDPLITPICKELVKNGINTRSKLSGLS